MGTIFFKMKAWASSCLLVYFLFQVMLDYNKKLTFSFFRFSYLRTREWRKWRIYIFNNLTNESEFENLKYYFFSPPSSSHFSSFSIKEHVHDTVLVTETRKHPIQPMNEVEKQTLQETQIELAWNPLSNVMAIIGMCLYFSFICKSWRRRCKTRVRVLIFRKWRWQFSTPDSYLFYEHSYDPEELEQMTHPLAKAAIIYSSLENGGHTHDEMFTLSFWSSYIFQTRTSL